MSDNFYEVIDFLGGRMAKAMQTIAHFRRMSQDLPSVAIDFIVHQLRAEYFLYAISEVPLSVMAGMDVDTLRAHLTSCRDAVTSILLNPPDMMHSMPTEIIRKSAQLAAYKELLPIYEHALSRLSQA